MRMRWLFPSMELCVREDEIMGEKKEYSVSSTMVGKGVLLGVKMRKEGGLHLLFCLRSSTAICSSPILAFIKLQ